MQSRKDSFRHKMSKLFSSRFIFTIYFTNDCTKIFVIIVNTCVSRRSVDNKALILSYPGDTRGYKRLQGVTRDYMGLQEITGGFKGLQGITKG